MVQRQTRQWARVLFSIGLALLAAGAIFSSEGSFAVRIGSAIAILAMVGITLLFANHPIGPVISMGFLTGIGWIGYYYNGDSFFLISGVLSTPIFLYRLARYREGTIFMPSN